MALVRYLETGDLRNLEGDVAREPEGDWILPVSIVTCVIEGPALRRVAFGPGTAAFDLDGPSNEPVEGVVGPSLSHLAEGPAVVTATTDGPSIQARSVDGPELGRDATGPAIEAKYAFAGPGVWCDDG